MQQCLSGNNSVRDALLLQMEISYTIQMGFEHSVTIVLIQEIEMTNPIGFVLPYKTRSPSHSSFLEFCSNHDPGTRVGD